MDFYSVDENNFWNKFILTMTIYAVTFMLTLHIQINLITTQFGWILLNSSLKWSKQNEL